jgi:UDPglucose 6-dehydrogenase
MQIAVFGTGYVGTVTGTCFADLGNRVVCVDVDAPRVERLRAGDPVIYEPGLREMLEKNLRAGRIEFTTDAARGVEGSEAIFICVGTPSQSDGAADLRYVDDVARSIGEHMRDYAVVVNKSTVPVGTYERVRREITARQAGRGIPFDVVSNPEFLREGAAIQDFHEPDRIVVGTDSARAREILARLYDPLTRAGRPLLVTTIPSAELIKYASNAMLATRISFMNELAQLCEAVPGASIEDVARGMGMDSRIGPRFLQAGCGYGGSCFPKDVRELAARLEAHGLPSTLLQAVDYINDRQKRSVVQKLKRLLPSLDGATVAVWGLAFKPRTDDVREAPSLTVIRQLLRDYASVRAYDPEAMENIRRLFPEEDKVALAKDAYDALEGADALVILTEWDEFRSPDLSRVAGTLRRKIVVDGRNVLDPAQARAHGLTYVSVGRA